MQSPGKIGGGGPMAAVKDITCKCTDQWWASGPCSTTTLSESSLASNQATLEIPRSEPHWVTSSGKGFHPADSLLGVRSMAWQRRVYPGTLSGGSRHFPFGVRTRFRFVAALTSTAPLR
eukprot:scaffold1449_cov244-Pinguiococcus_pyrenoidosus.AAC.11